MGRPAVRAPALGLAVLVALVPLGVSACGVPVKGVTGLTLTDDGSVAVVVDMCRGLVDGVVLYGDDEAAPNGSIDHGRWNSGDKRYSSTQFVIDSSKPASPWNTEIGWNGVVPRGQTWTIFAGSADASSSSYPLSFNRADLKRLQAGEVLVPKVEFGGGAADPNLLKLDRLHDLACFAAS